jgi:Holliday junction resolvase RusA-like endonuclease
LDPKNIKRYQEEFEGIPSDQFERLNEYLKSNPLNDKQRKNLIERIKENTSVQWNYLKIVLDIIPEPTPRPRITQSGHFYVKNSRKNNRFVELMVKNDEDLYHFIKTPCIYTVTNYFPIPKGFSKVDTILAELGLNDMITIPDWDNLGKTYSDMIQKWILANDSLIIDGRSKKFYSLKPRVEILIQYKQSHSCKRNKRMVEQSLSVVNNYRNTEIP